MESIKTTDFPQGGSRISVRGHQFQGGRQPIIRAKLSQNLHKSGKNWPRVGTRPKCVYVDPSMPCITPSVTLSRWFSAYDSDLNSERSRFDPPLGHQRFKPL